MKVEWVNPFILNAILVFEQMANIKFEKSALSLKDDPKPSNEISILIGITGFIQGQVIYSLKEQTAQRITQSIAPKSVVEVDNALVESTIAEIANIITGRTTVQLSGDDKILHITPPTIIIGKEYSINFIKMKTISVSLTSRYGTLEVNVALKDMSDAM